MAPTQAPRVAPSEPAGDRQPALMLVASGQEWLARSLESILTAHGHQVLRATGGRQALEQARNAVPDLVILDLHLPETDGLDLCRALRSEPRISPATPILVTLHGQTGREERLEALRAGAWDVIGFPLDAEELGLKVAAFIRAKEEADEARAEGLLDPATGLYNLRGLLTRATELTADAKRHERPLGFIVVALEAATPAGQKEKGEEGRGAQQAGPSWVNQLAQVLSTGLRLADTLGRFGETEFVVIAPNTGPDGTHRLAERLLMLARHFADSQAELPALNVRIGCYGIPNLAEEPAEPVELLVRAVMALRRAQASGVEICSFGAVS